MATSSTTKSKRKAKPHIGAGGFSRPKAKRLANKRIRYLLEAKNDPHDFWGIIRVCDTRKEALAICKEHIDQRKWCDSIRREHSTYHNFYRVVRGEEKVVFTERKEVFE